MRSLVLVLAGIGAAAVVAGLVYPGLVWLALVGLPVLLAAAVLVVIRLSIPRS